MSTGVTQIARARQGEITAAMSTVAAGEGLSPDFVRGETARGRMIIPSNVRHHGLTPIGIGIGARCKVNVNVGLSPGGSDVEGEMEKLRVCLRYGADTVMDLSVSGDGAALRRRIIAESPLPVGTVPIYEAASRADDVASLDAQDFVETIRAHAEQGVDFLTVHCGLLRRMVPLACRRTLGIVSRGGALIARWMQAREEENPFYSRFDDVLSICREYDVTLSLGDGLRPGCLADASDAAQFAELDVLGELTRRCWDAGVQVMVEGPGHIPFDQIAENVERQIRVCHGAPFYVLGPVVCDIGAGYDHITAAIGATAAATAGAALLCYVTPKEHLGLPDVEDVRAGLMAFKIAAHAADVARRRPGARDRDDQISSARSALDWERQFSLSLDPDRSREYFLSQNAGHRGSGQDYCSMCGERYCAIRTFREVRRNEIGASA